MILSDKDLLLINVNENLRENKYIFNIGYKNKNG